MKSMLIPAIAMLLALATGCSNKKPPETTANTALDVSPSPSVTPPVASYTPSPYTSSAIASPDASATVTPAIATGGSSYVVKKGDTLYAIARTHYGDGKQWQRIASANPGVSPQTLRVGQTITLP